MKQKFKTLKTSRSYLSGERSYYERLKTLSLKLDNSLSYWLLLASKQKWTAKQINEKIDSLSFYWNKRAKSMSESYSKRFAKNLENYVNLKFKKQSAEFSLKESSRLVKNEMNAILERNVALIKTIPKEIIERYRSEILNNVSNLDKELLEKRFKTFQGISKRRAATIARDQTQKAINDIQNAKAQQLGFNYYIWRTAKDSRVSDEHRHLEGRIYAFDKPTAIIDSYGNAGHTAQRPNCRCWAEPLMLLPTQELVLKKDAKHGSYYEIKDKE